MVQSECYDKANRKSKNKGGRPKGKKSGLGIPQKSIKEAIALVKLAHEICCFIEEPKNRAKNPQAISIKDAVFGLALKTYSNAVIRRFHSDLKLAREAGYITREYHFNTMKDHLHHPHLRAILKDLIELSALPVKPLEQYFAADATGFSSSKFIRWFDVRTQKTSKKRVWRKCHAVCGVLTNVVTSVELTDGDVHDSTQFKKMVSNTAQNFEFEEHIIVIWKNFKKSEKELSPQAIHTILNILNDHKDHIQFVKD